MNKYEPLLADEDDVILFRDDRPPDWPDLELHVFEGFLFLDDGLCVDRDLAGRIGATFLQYARTGKLP